MEDNTNKVKIDREKRKSKKSKRRFWFGYRIYVGVLVLLIVIMCFAVWNTMKKYEKAQPEYVVEEVVNRLEEGNLSDLKNTVGQGNKFEKGEDISDEFLELVKGKELTYRLSSESYDSLAPEYDVLSGKETVAKITLKSIKEKKKMAILVLSEWEVTGVTPVMAAGNYQITVTAPSNYKVAINGVELSADEKKGDAKAYEGFDYVAEYVEAPSYQKYRVKELSKLPELSINGVIVDSSLIKNDNGKLSYKCDYEVSEIPAELSEYVVEAAKTYSNFFSRDLPGCYDSTDCIQHLFPIGSYYITMAENYRQQDMWTYSRHDVPPEFNNVTVANYVSYSDKCFSVDVSFDKSIILWINGETRIDKSRQKYFYVNIDGKWLIADMREQS